MKLLDDLKMYLRFASGLRSYVHHKLTLAEAEAIVRRRLAERENRFLRLVRRGIFEYAQSPYLPLMRYAGCEFGDVQSLVQRQGLEDTLLELRRAGVYVSYEELKGRVPLVRGSQTFSVDYSRFDNPYLKAQYSAESGGTTGAGRRVPLELDHQAEQTPQLMLTRQAHGCLNAPTAIWRGPIPDGTGVAHMLRTIRFGRIPQRWFTADLRGEARPRLSYRLASQCFVHTLHLLSVPIPRPEPLPLDQAIVAARWAGDSIRRHGSCCIITPAGRALRICLAAQEAGIDLTGLVFVMGGEPITEAKAQSIKNSGARYFPTYAMFELGQMALGCANPRCSDDLHLIRDCFLLITYPKSLPSGETVDALNFTSIMPTAPLIMFNAEIDDQAQVDEHSCGCPLEALGYTQHITNVSSYSKLVTEGVSFVGRDAARVLEQVLPARFGGSPVDYQLVESEDAKGMTRVNLLVSPQINIPDQDELKSVFLAAMGKGPDSYAWASSLWRQGQTLQVLRQEPYATTRGKHLTLWRKKTAHD